MSSREHWSDDGKVHVKVSTISTNLAAFVEWGAEAWREKKHTIPFVWWNPFTWGGSEWRREGSVPDFTVTFFRANNSTIDNPNPPANIVNQPGYGKLTLVYYLIGDTFDPNSATRVGPPSTGNTNFLGDDARAVVRIEVAYTWNGQRKTLSAP
jgi:hypothetical protein